MKPGDEYYAVSLKTGKQYRINEQHETGNASIDISILSFQSDEDFYVSILNYASVGIGDDCMEFADDSPEQIEWQTCRPFTRTLGVSAPTQAISVPIVRITGWNDLMPRVSGNKDGYEFMYEASTVPGMSGGAIMGDRELCPTGSEKQTSDYALIAIHGRSEDYSAGGRTGISLGVPIDLIKDFIARRAPDLGIPLTHDEIKKVAIEQYCM